MNLDNAQAVIDTQTNPGAPPEPIFVFGSNIAGNHETGDSAFAIRFHGAVEGKGSGRLGNSYAIPAYDSELRPLPLSVIENYIKGFLTHAAKNSQTIFQINRIGCGNEGYKDEQMAPLFKQAGANCRLPGLWLRIFDKKPPLRIIIHDPDAQLTNPATQKCLDEYFSINLPLWGGQSVEIVSVGRSKSIVANDNYSRAHKYRHRIIGSNQKYYGADSEMARIAKAVWYATHMVCFVDPDQTNDRRQIRLISTASRNGLTVEAVKIN